MFNGKKRNITAVHDSFSPYIFSSWLLKREVETPNEANKFQNDTYIFYGCALIADDISIRIFYTSQCVENVGFRFCIQLPTYIYKWKETELVHLHASIFCILNCGKCRFLFEENRRIIVDKLI